MWPRLNLEAEEGASPRSFRCYEFLDKAPDFGCSIVKDTKTKLPRDSNENILVTKQHPPSQRHSAAGKCKLRIPIMLGFGVSGMRTKPSTLSLLKLLMRKCLHPCQVFNDPYPTALQQWRRAKNKFCIIQNKLTEMK